MRNPRVLVAVAVLAVLGLVAGVAFMAGGSQDDTDPTVGAGGPPPPAKPVRTVRSELTLERFVLPTTGQPEELVVSLPEQRLNVLETTGGETEVLLRCVDKGGTEKLRQMVAWPLLEETGLPPHTHQAIRPDVLDAVRGCRLTGPGIDFEGRVPGRVPSGE